MTDAITVLTSGSLSAIASLLVWTMFSTRLKASIEHENEEKLSKFKEELRKQTEGELARLNSELTHQNEMAITIFRHNLELVATERNLRFSKVFERTAEVIADTYFKLADLSDAID